MLNNISIKTRLYLVSAISSLMLILVSLTSYYGIKQVMNGAYTVYSGGIEEMNLLQSMNQVIYRDIFSILRELRYGAISVTESQVKISEAFSDLNKKYDLYFATIETSFQPAAQEVRELISRVQEKMNVFFSSLSDQESLTGIAEKQKDLFTILNQAANKIKDLSEGHYKATRQDYEQTIATGELTLIKIFIIVGLGMLLTLIFEALIIRSINKPLIEIVHVVDRLSTGDTSQELTPEGNNEAQQVMSSVQKMITNTKKMGQALTAVAEGDLVVDSLARSENDTIGKAVDHMISSLKRMIAQIQAEVSSLTSSTQEIVASVNQVSTGTSETAAAVNETTATMEELKQTTHVSAEKATDVLNTVENTLAVVKKGEKTLQLTLNEMNQIEEKMRIISQSIVKLSEHSTAIGEIINTVNNLAEQSNLLAVNAAIEAAKAGDQGKSFGVVAQEIRTLAEQSKAATIQVRAILNDIQNATSSAILATEQGSKAVAKGVSQSSEMAEAIHALNSSISHVSMAANQISISSQQQLVGVDQVTVAMTNINEATNQHVENMRQIEIAVHSLNEVALVLKQLVGQYRVDNDGSLNKNYHAKVSRNNENDKFNIPHTGLFASHRASRE